MALSQKTSDPTTNRYVEQIVRFQKKSDKAEHTKKKKKKCIQPIVVCQAFNTDIYDLVVVR